MENKQMSYQMVGAIMMALQKGILEGIDLTEVFRGFVIKDSDEGLVVTNPPVLDYSTLEEDSETEE